MFLVRADGIFIRSCPENLIWQVQLVEKFADFQDMCSRKQTIIGTVK